MRDRRFVAEHRGGPLTAAEHRSLMVWAIICSTRVLPLLEGNVDQRLACALRIAERWLVGIATTGECMKASVAAHTAAREAGNPVAMAVARSVGQCVATAHMADHSMGAALYALKAVSKAGGSVGEERAFQLAALRELPPRVVKLVMHVMTEKARSFRL